MSLLISWPMVGAAALLIGAFCGSMAAGGTALIIARKTRASSLRQGWIEELESETHAAAANDGAEAHLRPRQYA